ncbi:MAG: hypothetical protein EA417_18185, partial [Gammaproteobacteria bacterium]
MPRALQRSLIALLVGLCAAGLTVSWPAPATAQSQADVQRVMSMSPAERQRLMRQFGVSEQDILRMMG